MTDIKISIPKINISLGGIPNNELSNRNKINLSLEEFSKEIVCRCKQHPFLNWNNTKTEKSVKKLYKKGYSVSDVFSFILLS